MHKLILYGVIFFQILLIGSLFKGIQLAIKARSRVTDLEARKAKVQEEQKKLSDQLTYVQSDYYVEKVAREELQLSKPGETVVLVPQNAAITPDGVVIAATAPDKPNYQKWWDVIRGKTLE
jgi:cell division protein FtsB